MKKSLNFLALAAAATVLLSLPSAAKAQVTVRGPHGSFSIGGGAPFLPEVGAYVPSPYDADIYENGDDGYGFYYNDEWIPCTRYGSRWVIVERPVVYGGRGYGYARPYAYGYSRPYGGFGRRDGFVGRRGFEGQREFQGQGRREFQGQGRSQFQGQGRIQSQGRSQFQGQQDRGSRGNGNRSNGNRGNGSRQGNRDGRRGSDRRQ